MAHLLPWNIVKNPNWAIARRSLRNETQPDTSAEIIEKCGESCMIYYTLGPKKAPAALPTDVDDSYSRIDGIFMGDL